MKLDAALLPCLLVLAAAPACDLAPTDDGMASPDEAADDTNEDDANDEDDGNEDDASNEDDGDDPSDDGNGDDDGANDDDDDDANDTGIPEFDNDFGEATSALAGMWFVCSVSADDYYNVHFLDSAEVHAKDMEGQTYVGMYAVDSERLTLSFPQLDYVESSVGHEIEADVLATFTMPSLACHATVLRDVASYESESVRCPSIKYIPEVSYEDNEFHFGNDGGVKRRRWRELTGANDTLYSEIYGVYLTFGDWVVMLFGDADEGERVLTGVVTEDGLYIEQLEPDKGACN